MSFEKFASLLSILCCPSCKHDLILKDSFFECLNCSTNYPIIENIPRFVPENYWNLNTDNDEITKKTKNYFGFEWDYFNDWGFIDDSLIPNDKNFAYLGGTSNARKKTFDTKVRLSNSHLKPDTFTLDAGCGNGRYTYEAGLRSQGIVIGVDIGYGSVKSAYKNTTELDNVFILQANLFDLPFKDNILDNAFSNGVLMHTGNAKKAFYEICRIIKPNGFFVAHVYNKLNPFWEFNDRVIRFFTTKMSIESNLKLAKFLAKVGRRVELKKNGFKYANYFIRLQSTVHHMFDWYSAPIATHHTFNELKKWFSDNQFETMDSNPKETFWDRPWAVNILGKKN